MNGQKKSASPLPSDGTQKLIEQLRAQAKHAEERGNFDSAHHQMLKRILAANDANYAKEQKQDKEIDDGKKDL